MGDDNVVPFHDPERPLMGKTRAAAIECYREALPEIAARSIGDAFSLTCQLTGCGNLSIEDALPLFVDAFRRELDKPVM
jgi:hypothetical protein